ncbi:hypothetical protein Taro_031534 [Colocasia esculenta]|uniref:ABC transporter domain-containing protein n=1 Tax=Colocasia esculenta TaxID=4460 RepID=A0A843VS76_COLES|nr:hypothetical protein [Colocasia esculenta]
MVALMDPGDGGDRAFLIPVEGNPAPEVPASSRPLIIPTAVGKLLKRVGDSTRSNDDADDDDDLQAPPPPSTPSPHHRLAEIRGSSPPPPLVLSFSELSYSVKLRKRSILSLFRGSDEGHGEGRMKVLLDSVSGEAREGQIMAVLGPSGSGKSTLIDALAGRIARGSLRGRVALNGEDLQLHRGHLLKAISEYVMQDDLLHPMLTVEETLTFAADFRLPRSMARSRKRERVKNLIDQLGLRDAAGTIIGNEYRRGISGGERRRVSIGADIIHDPIVLFLDEPTSGLDSTSAYQVVKVLKGIALTGSVLVMAMHQPSARILGLLDRLLFLSRGRAVYSGCPEGLPDFFAGFEHPIPEKESRTEFALDLIRELEGSPGGTDALADYYRQWQDMHRRDGAVSFGDNSVGFTLRDAISASISRGKLVSGAAEVGKTTGVVAGGAYRVPTFANPFWVEVWVLTKRALINSRRQPEIFAVWLGTVLTTSFIIAALFWRLPRSIAGIQERLGFLAVAITATFYICAVVLQELIDERYIFIRETAHNSYRRSSYVLATTVAGIPSLLPISISFAAVTYFATGLAGGFSGFLFYLAVIFTCFWTGISYMTFLSGVTPDMQVGFPVMLLSIASFLIVSGFMATRDRIPAYWKWLHYMSLVKYPYEALMHNEFDDPRRCFVRGDQMFDQVPLLEGLAGDTKAVLLQGMETMLGVSMKADTCVVNGPYVLKLQGLTQLGKWQCVLILLAVGFLLKLLFYFSLLVGSRNKRR